MSTNNELLRKILKHSDLKGSVEMPKDIDRLTVSEAKKSEDPYVSACGEILHQLGLNKNVSSTAVYTSVQQLLRTKL
tara:strand:- start:369 stop:599 length:231 start_codon:yes stop_codon:yes gene_type:complete